MKENVVIDVAGVPVELVASADLSADDLNGLLGNIVTCDGISGAVRVHIEGQDLEGSLAAAVRVAIDRSDQVLIHAGAVSCGGRAVIFPGESGSGKSTLTAACVRRGLSYLTDEMVAIDIATTGVTGFSRPMMLTRWAASILDLDGTERRHRDEKLAVTPARLGGNVARQPVRIAHVVEVRHGAVHTMLEPKTASEGVAMLLRSSFNHYRHGELAWRAVVAAAADARCWTLDVSQDLDQAADTVTELLRS